MSRSKNAILSNQLSRDQIAFSNNTSAQLCPHVEVVVGNGPRLRKLTISCRTARIFAVRDENCLGALVYANSAINSKWKLIRKSTQKE